MPTFALHALFFWRQSDWRPFVWKEVQAIDLLDSIANHYPISAFGCSREKWDTLHSDSSGTGALPHARSKESDSSSSWSAIGRGPFLIEGSVQTGEDQVARCNEANERDERQNDV